MPPTASPTKRRKTTSSKRGMSSNNPKKGNLCSYHFYCIGAYEQLVVQTPKWPTKSPDELLPIEIYNTICDYLPRSSIEMMRLVCKEFESKVSPHLFRWVVVPFKPEIYGIAPEPTSSGLQNDGTDDMLQGALMLQDKGMRVFQGYGGRILKFAMSFELDLVKLAHPPIKSDQEVLVSFWGAYRWPFQKYNRYTQLEGLEQTADETRTMSKALRFICSADELGLSIDSGLGWLSGPDTNTSVMDRGDKVKVFGTSRFASEPKPMPQPKEKKPFKRAYGIASMAARRSHHNAYERILQETNPRLQGPRTADGNLVDVEGPQMEGFQHEFTSALGLSSSMTELERLESSEGLAVLRRRTLLSPMNSFTPDFEDVAPAPELPDQILQDTRPFPYIEWSDEEEEEEETAASTPGRTIPKSTPVKETYPLKPNDLTSAQREMLLEIEWAQRAFMQSYAIAVIDNPDTFQNIKTFTIARLPNRFLPILNREDFWDSLPALESLSLAVIPDWREVVKLPTSYVQDIRLSPSKSVSAAYQFLSNQIARRENITTVHFEWLCGGEEAPGIFARNHLILAAPVVPEAVGMVDRTKLPLVLSMPHVTKLSLKNCWFSPHVLKLFCLTFKHSRLTRITLDSVSLTAPIPPNTHPNPIIHNIREVPQNAVQVANAVANAAAVNNMMGNVQVGIQGPNGQQINFAVVPPNINPGLLAAAGGPGQIVAGETNADDTDDWQPADDEKYVVPVESWVSIIETLTPSHYKSLRFREEELGEPDAQPLNHNPSIVPTLTRLIFKSCGYVHVPLDFDQSMIGANRLPRGTNAQIMKRVSDIEGVMMKPSNDNILGDIINHLCPIEQWQLVNGYFFDTNWPATPEYMLQITDAVLDGIQSPGDGRFSGTISQSDTKPSSKVSSL